MPLAKADLFECRETAMDAVLLELGFMDSKTDLRAILSADWADKCAAAIVSVIAERAHLKRKGDTMKKGDRNLGVYTLKKLMALAAALGVTLPSGLADNGDFGDGTEQNLKALQSLSSLPPTGVADANAVAGLYALLKARIETLRSQNATLQFQYDRMKEQIKQLRSTK